MILDSRNKKHSFAFFIIAAYLLASCASSNSAPNTLPDPEISIADESPAPLATASIEIINLSDAFGRSVTIEGRAERIISLASNITESLFAIGAANQIVATDNLSLFPSQAQDLPKIGDYFADFNAGVYIEFFPDLVLVNENFPVESILGLEALGFPVFVLENPNNIEGLLSNISLIGTLSGNQAMADSLLQEMDSRLNGIALRLQDIVDHPLVFYELEASDPNAPWTYGSGTFPNEILQLAGGINAAQGLSGAWVQIQLSDLLLSDPKIILLADAAFGVEAESLSSREAWAGLTAVQNGSIFPIDDTLLSNPGPRIVDLIEELAALFHPNLFD